MDPRPPANRGWGWGWTPDPRQIGGGGGGGPPISGKSGVHPRDGPPIVGVCRAAALNGQQNEPTVTDAPSFIQQWLPESVLLASVHTRIILNQCREIALRSSLEDVFPTRDSPTVTVASVCQHSAHLHVQVRSPSRHRRRRRRRRQCHCLRRSWHDVERSQEIASQRPIEVYSGDDGTCASDSESESRCMTGPR